jgi:serine/threonine protein kinase
MNWVSGFDEMELKRKIKELEDHRHKQSKKGPGLGQSVINR